MNFPENLSKEEWLAGANQFGKGYAVDALGINITDIDDESITLRMEITDKALQPFGLLHGGINLFLAETAGGMHSVWGIDLNEKVPVGIEVNASHVRSVDSGVLIAKGTVVRKSTNMAVHTVEITHEESGLVISTARITHFYKRVNGE